MLAKRYNTKLEDIKAMFARMGITYDNDEDYYEAYGNLIGYFDILIQMDLEQKASSKSAELKPEKQM